MPRIKQQFHDRDLKCAKWMLNKIREIRPKFRQPNLSNWAVEIRLMRERDKRTYNEIYQVFSWANNHPFWRINILSPAKLRQQFDRLSLQMEKENSSPQKISPAFHKSISPKTTVEIRSNSGERSKPPKEFYKILNEIGLDPRKKESKPVQTTIKKPKRDYQIIYKEVICSKCKKKSGVKVIFQKQPDKPYCLNCAIKEVNYE